MKKRLLGIGVVFCIGCLELGDARHALAALPVQWEVSEGIQSPESVHFDTASGFLFVSNVGTGGATEKDGGGFISKLTPDGRMVEPKWVAGLNAPKGLHSHGGTLWVSDIDRVVGIDIA